MCLPQIFISPDRNFVVVLMDTVRKIEKFQGSFIFSHSSVLILRMHRVSYRKSIREPLPVSKAKHSKLYVLILFRILLYKQCSRKGAIK